MSGLMRILASMERGEVWDVGLDPIKGSEQRGQRPCVIVSHVSMNKALSTVIVVPLSTKMKNWPTRVAVSVSGKEGQALCEQIRTVSKERLIRQRGTLNVKEIAEIKIVLRQIFFDDQ